MTSRPWAPLPRGILASCPRLHSHARPNTQDFVFPANAPMGHGRLPAPLSQHLGAYSCNRTLLPHPTFHSRSSAPSSTIKTTILRQPGPHGPEHHGPTAHGYAAAGSRAGLGPVSLQLHLRTSKDTGWGTPRGKGGGDSSGLLPDRLKPAPLRLLLDSTRDQSIARLAGSTLTRQGALG